MGGIQRWFGLLIVVAALHMTEQLIIGLDELYIIRHILRGYYRWFKDADFATVLLVTIVVLFVLTLLYGVLLGGRPLLWVMGFFVLIALSEVHHVIESIVQRRYVSGTVTAVLWMADGVMLGLAVWQQARLSSSVASAS